MGARIAMMTDIDFERVSEDRIIDFIGAEEEGQLRLLRSQRLDPTFIGVTEHQPAHARRSEVEDVEAVPTIPHQLVLLGECQRSPMRAFVAQRAATNDDRGAFGRLEGIGHMLGQLGEQAEVRAEEFRFVRQVRVRSDREHLRAALADSLLDAGVDERCLTTEVRANEQDHIGILDIRDAGVEVDGGQARRVISEACLAAFKHRAAERLHQLARGKHRFAIDLIACDGGNRLAGLISSSGDSLQRIGPLNGHELTILANERLVEAALHKAIDRVARLIARPFLVHVFVDARHGAQHLTATAVEADVGAHGIHHVDGGSVLQFPRPRHEGVGLGCQRTDGAEINNIARELTGDSALKIAGDLHILAATNRADFFNPRHFFGKADTARALDAARHHRLDERAHILLGHGALVLVIARATTSISHRLILQIALATLIANRAIERVVDEKKLHHPFTRLLHHRTVSLDDLTFGGGQRARRLRLGRTRRDFDQTHAAIARDGQPLMIAEARDFLARQFTRLKDSGACGDFDFGAVYGDFRHVLLRGPKLLRHAELVSASTLQRPPAVQTAPWTLKQVQGDGLER